MRGWFVVSADSTAVLVRGLLPDELCDETLAAEPDVQTFFDEPARAATPDIVSRSNLLVTDFGKRRISARHAGSLVPRLVGGLVVEPMRW